MMVTQNNGPETVLDTAYLPVTAHEVVWQVVVNERVVLTFHSPADWEYIAGVIEEADENLRGWGSPTGVKPEQTALDAVMTESLGLHIRGCMAIWLMARTEVWPVIPPTRPDHVEMRLDNDSKGGMIVRIRTGHVAEGGIQ